MAEWPGTGMTLSYKAKAVDDELSGTGFAFWPSQLRKYVVLCQEGVGLQGLDYQRLIEAFTLRSGVQNSSSQP
jgi:hypothetical protein